MRIHTFHLNFYLTARRAHVHIEGVRWEVVKLKVYVVNRGPWVVKGKRVERTIEITSDEFLKPAQ